MNPDVLPATLHDRVPGLMAVHAFGSRVQGSAGPDSGLDLAVSVAGELARRRSTWVSTR